MAVTAILTEGAVLAPRETREMRLSALDGEDRLVQWINEVLYGAVVTGFLIAEVVVTVDGPGDLSAIARGEPGAHDRVRTELKSATYHDLEIAARDGLVYARVVIDV